MTTMPAPMSRTEAEAEAASVSASASGTPLPSLSQTATDTASLSLHGFSPPSASSIAPGCLSNLASIVWLLPRGAAARLSS